MAKIRNQLCEAYVKEFPVDIAGLHISEATIMLNAQAEAFKRGFDLCARFTLDRMRAKAKFLKGHGAGISEQNAKGIEWMANDIERTLKE